MRCLDGDEHAAEMMASIWNQFEDAHKAAM